MQTATAGRQPDTTPSPDAVDLSRTALLLDVDGTLLDIAATPAEVTVPPALRRILADLIDRSGGAVALVSGRTIDAIDRLFAPLVAPAIGGHGAERRIFGSKPIRWMSPAVLSPSLRHQLRLLARIDPRVIVEDKSHSIAMHYRLVPEQEAFLKTSVSEIVLKEASGDVEFLFGKCVIDVKPKLFSKGLAVQELMTCKPFAGRTPLFVGDDTTDESAFAMLPALNGYGYSVGKAMAGTQGTFLSPQDVRSWLERLWSRGNAT